MELKIMTWNIKGAASLGWNNQYKIDSLMVDKIIKQDADIIVLTEFVIAKGLDYLFERFQNEGYIWFISNRSGKNGILIGIKKDLIKADDLVNEVYNSNTISSVVEGCNILRVAIPLQCGINLCIIGCRMETGGAGNLQAQYDSASNNFDNILLPMISSLEKDHIYIVCGDFNNARCCGNLNEKFNPRNYNGKAQINYNLNIIKDKFERIGFKMTNVGKTGESIPTHNGYVPDDHIFVHGLEPKKSDTTAVDKLSDHDILVAECLAFLNKDYEATGDYFKDGGETYTIEELLIKIESDLGYGQADGEKLIKKCVERGYISDCGNNTYSR
ncbi:hypothetical protein RH915_10285 [Serpentinicella sp. ANB-PHB4]|uniref:endonuclease/exonuclease/phosphatase family protein n=1 Tax=Serpentinicella sp. ANB-PHB4 TaxID=3074076 RepID=UPI00285868F9|nr:endonuclease/exonuclease/phosphatase family protein [Serpentinicella sp. ANB-PHB4]MDR5659877.1 hypothetical protein [Serpentinicella sp. ANB-PHB4]